jgi:hypothetical protein
MPLRLQESRDLNGWTPSSAKYMEDPDGSFRWYAPWFPGENHFFRLAVPAP